MSHLRNFLQRWSGSALILNSSSQRGYSNKLRKFAKIYPDHRKRDSIAHLEYDENTMLCFLRLNHYKRSETSKASSSNVVYCGDYATGRPRPLNPDLNPETVTMLKYPFTPSIVPRNVPTHIPKYITYSNYVKHARVYLVGTNHLSKESQKDVKETILQTQPDAIVVELCPHRCSYILQDELQCSQEDSKAGNLKNLLRNIRQHGLRPGIRVYRMEAKHARMCQELDTEYGGEFRVAFNGDIPKSTKLSLRVRRSIYSTYPHAIPQTKYFAKAQKMVQKKNDNDEKYGKTLAERLERTKKKDALEEMSKERTSNEPEFHKIIIEERDQYMTYILHKLVEKHAAEKFQACKLAGVPYEPVTIVAVVGIGHIAGMKARWNTNLHKDDFQKLLSFHMPRRIPKLIKWMLEVAAFGIAYLCYLQFAASEGNEKVSQADEELLAISDEGE